MSLKLEKDKLRFNRYIEELLKSVKSKDQAINVKYFILAVTTQYLGLTESYIKKRIKLIIEAYNLNLVYDEVAEVVYFGVVKDVKPKKSKTE